MFVSENGINSRVKCFSMVMKRKFFLGILLSDIVIYGGKFLEKLK